MDADDGRVVSNFIMQALRGEPITIYGDGSQTRSFCFYSDMVRAFITMMESGDDFVGPVNLGNPGEFTIGELAEKIIQKVGGKTTINYHPLPADDPKQRCPDIGLAKARLDWQPSVALDEGLDETIEWFRNNYQ